MDIRVQVGRRIRLLRKRRELTQRQLADLAEISQTHLSELENGKREICLLMIQRLAIAFEVPPADLLK